MVPVTQANETMAATSPRTPLEPLASPPTSPPSFHLARNQAHNPAAHQHRQSPSAAPLPVSCSSSVPPTSRPSSIHPSACAGVTHMDEGKATSSTNEPQPDPMEDSIEDQVRQIQRGPSSAEEKQRLIHQLFASRRNSAQLKRPRKELEVGVFPGAGASPGCDHYVRKCWIKADCCQQYFPCRRCHDEVHGHDHEIDRHATKLVACVECGEVDQPVAEKCRACNVTFAEYFCSICRFYDSLTDKDIYHCPGCGICRVGKGLGIDNYHCNQCNLCVPMDVMEGHTCKEKSLDCNCPICGEYLATSTAPVVFLRCMHPIHKECLENHSLHSYTCPICSRSIPEDDELQEFYSRIDARLELDIMPEEFATMVSRISCNDCEHKTLARFHFHYHRCANCNGYNTRVLGYMKGDPENLPPRPTKIPRVFRRSDDEDEDEDGQSPMIVQEAGSSSASQPMQ